MATNLRLVLLVLFISQFSAAYAEGSWSYSGTNGGFSAIVEEGAEVVCSEIASRCVDGDGDGYGAEGSDVSACRFQFFDCNDVNSNQNPGLTEIANNNLDDDCDAFTKDSDADGDGIPSPADCNDNDLNIYPNAKEICDGKDNNCDGDYLAAEKKLCDFQNSCGAWQQACAADQMCTKQANGEFQCAAALTSSYKCITDADRDSYCAEEFSAEGVRTVRDCDDNNYFASPGAQEVCKNSKDDNCNSQIDEQPCFSGLCQDADQDGYGAAGSDLSRCSYTSVEDCDDNDIYVKPGLDEICDGKDNNCNGQTDEDVGWQDGASYAGPKRSEQGVCRLATAACIGGSWQWDYGTAYQSEEGMGDTAACNDGVDNDCDGLLDCLAGNGEADNGYCNDYCALLAAQIEGQIGGGQGQGGGAGSSASGGTGEAVGIPQLNILSNILFRVTEIWRTIFASYTGFSAASNDKQIIESGFPSPTHAALLRSNCNGDVNSNGIIVSSAFGAPSGGIAWSQKDQSENTQLTAEVLDANTNNVLAATANAGKPGAWGSTYLDVSKHAGKQVKLRFSQHTTKQGSGGYTLIDNVEMLVGSSQIPINNFEGDAGQEVIKKKEVLGTIEVFIKDLDNKPVEDRLVKIVFDGIDFSQSGSSTDGIKTNSEGKVILTGIPRYTQYYVTVLNYGPGDDKSVALTPEFSAQGDFKENVYIEFTAKFHSFIQRGCTQLVKSGDPKDKLDIVFVGDDYSDDIFGKAADKLKNDAQVHSDKLFSVEPFKSNKRKINTYVVTKIEDLGCGASGDKRIILCNSQKVTDLASLCPRTDQVIVIYSSDWFGEKMQRQTGEDGIAITHPKYPGITLHEFGHSFGGLGDEYVEPGEGATKDIDYYSSPGSGPNCDGSPKCTKWAGVRGTGCFKGCWYDNLYRSIDNGIMKDPNANTYGVVNERHMTELLEQYK